jgi:hypothetical protein
MREPVDAERVRLFMRALGDAAPREGTCFLAGGTTAVLLGWRASTVDVDVALDPSQDEVLRALPRIKDELQINVELATPADFIPLPPGWRERSPSAGREGNLTFLHFDPYSQTLAKLERSHARDLEDVQAMIERGLVDRARLAELFDEIEPELYRFPAIDPASYRRRVAAAVRG